MFTSWMRDWVPRPLLNREVAFKLAEGPERPARGPFRGAWVMCRFGSFLIDLSASRKKVDQDTLWPGASPPSRVSSLEPEGPLWDCMSNSVPDSDAEYMAMPSSGRETWGSSSGKHAERGL
jgi:hypothetical protein